MRISHVNHLLMVLLGFGFSCFPCLSYLSCFPRQRIENWLYRLISPKINFEFHETEINSRKVVLLEIEKATEKPVQFSGTEYIRIGTYKKALKEFPGKERELWRRFDLSSFEDQIAKANIDESELLKLLDYPSYFDLMDIPLPEERKTAS